MRASVRGRQLDRQCSQFTSPSMLIKINILWPEGPRWSSVGEWITAAEAARRLGVKQASLYSYVSRGVLNRRQADGTRASLFSATEVERLARRGRPRRPRGAAELVIETQVTEIIGDQLRYRGHDAIGLARQYDFEDVAALLWTGTLGESGRDAGPWQTT